MESARRMLAIFGLVDDDEGGSSKKKKKMGGGRGKSKAKKGKKKKGKKVCSLASPYYALTFGYSINRILEFVLLIRHDLHRNYIAK